MIKAHDYLLQSSTLAREVGGARREPPDFPLIVKVSTTAKHLPIIVERFHNKGVPMSKTTPTVKVPKAAIQERIRVSDQSRVHVIAYKDRWAVKKEGTTRAHRVFDQKSDAIEGAKSLLQNQSSPGAIVVHGKDGAIDRWQKIPGSKQKK